MKHSIFNIKAYQIILFIIVIISSCEKKENFDVFPENPVQKVEIKSTPETIYCLGESLDLTGLIVSLHLEDGTIKDVEPKDFEFNRIKTIPENGSVFTEEIDSVEIIHLTSKHSTSYQLTFVTSEEKNPLKELTIKSLPSTMKYSDGMKLDLSGLCITLNFENGTSRDVEYKDFSLNGISVSPDNGSTLNKGNVTITITHNSSNKKISFDIEVTDYVYFPPKMEFPATWPDNNIWFITNFINVEQIDGGNANNSILTDAWVWAGGDFSSDWSIDNTTGYSYLNLPYENKSQGWAAWMFGGAFNLPNEIDKLSFKADIRGKGRWLIQLVDGSENHYSSSLDINEDEGWSLKEFTFKSFGNGDFDPSAISTIKIAAENTVTQNGDYINITNMRFEKKSE